MTDELGVWATIDGMKSLTVQAHIFHPHRGVPQSLKTDNCAGGTFTASKTDLLEPYAKAWQDRISLAVPAWAFRGLIQELDQYMLRKQ